MNLMPGKIIIATHIMDDPNFQDAMVFVARHDDNGTLGFIINKTYHRSLNELEEFKDSRKFPLYNGGPVDNEHLYFIHRRTDLIHNGDMICGNIFLGGAFSDAVSHINSGLLTTADIKIFIGYCGWDWNELESDIAEGYWDIMDEMNETIFSL